MAWEPVIGLECHIQLSTRSKMFCNCPVVFGAAANTNVCPVCLGLPGALPRTNREAVSAALRLGLSLECEIAPESVFARKNYFYPDMPKNFQISQYDRPLCLGGRLRIASPAGERAIELTRIHVEEDTGKSFHPERKGDRRVSRVDFNRAGVPLLELVTEPVFRNPAECSTFLTSLRRLIRYLGISGADMEKGQLRCDANVSVRPAGQQAFGTKTELKNLNSIKGVEKGLRAEIARQIDLLEDGESVEQSTLLYDVEHDRLAVMRSKEQAHDYRYFPEPDLPVLCVTQAWIEEARSALPELPWARATRIRESFGIPEYDAEVLTDLREVADYYEVLARAVDPKVASNWLMTEVLRVLKERGWHMDAWSERMPAERLVGLLEKVESKELPGPLAKQALGWMIDEDGSVDAVLKRHDVQVKASADELRPLVREVLAQHEGPVKQYLAGKTATLGFLVGQVMKQSGGQAVPQTVKELLEEELKKRAEGS